MTTKTHWKQQVTLQRLKELLNYDSETGIFTWAQSRRCVRAGEEAGTISFNGYVAIKVDGKLYRAHRLAWLWVTGTLPTCEIDHINRVRADNRILNLREATSSQNKCNQSVRKDNAVGITGVSYCMERNKFLAQIAINGKNRNLGRFDSIEAAEDAYITASKKMHGDFSRVGGA